MKTLILLSIITIAAVFKDGCQDREPEQRPVYRSLYLRQDNYNGRYCTYKVFETWEKKTVIDTICVYCGPQEDYSFDSIPNYCINPDDYRFIWDQEFHREDTSMTWRPLYLEKIDRPAGPVWFESACTTCPEGKRKFIKTYYGAEN
jgi:hypothetical protein